MSTEKPTIRINDNSYILVISNIKRNLYSRPDSNIYINHINELCQSYVENMMNQYSCYNRIKNCVITAPPIKLFPNDDYIDINKTIEHYKPCVNNSESITLISFIKTFILLYDYPCTNSTIYFAKYCPIILLF